LGKAFLEKSARQKAKKIHKTRTKRAKTMDARQSAKKTLSANFKNVEKWAKHPERYDIRLVDTEGAGREKSSSKTTKKKATEGASDEKYPHKSKRKMKYHDREGYPVIHKDKKTGKTYVMVRKKGGGTRRLYDYQRYMR